jgi:hypothetical protein
LRQIGDDLGAILSAHIYRDVYFQLPYRWRDRVLNPIATIHLFVLHILNHNTAFNHLARFTGQSFSTSAYCQARARLPLALLERLLERVAAAVHPLTEWGRWRRHRT